MGGVAGLAASKGPSPRLQFAEVPAEIPDMWADAGAQGPGGRLPPAGWDSHSPEQGGGWAGQGAQHRCWRGWQGELSSPERWSQGDFSRTRLTPASCPGGFSSRALGQVG